VGEYDGILTFEHPQTFARFSNGDQQLLIIKGFADAVVIRRNHRSFQHVAQTSLSLPDIAATGLLQWLMLFRGRART